MPSILHYFRLNAKHSALLLAFIKLPFVIKIFVLSFFEWPFYTGFTVYYIQEVEFMLNKAENLFSFLQDVFSNVTNFRN